MIAIQNADGTMVPVIERSPGAYGNVALSLVKQRQRRADIKFYSEDDESISRIGTMVLKKLPDNTFGEAEIALSLHINEQGVLHVSADTGEGAPYRDSFNLADLRPGRPVKSRVPQKMHTPKNKIRDDQPTAELAEDPLDDTENFGENERVASAMKTIAVPDGRMPGLMVAAVALFVISAAELIGYFLLRVLRP